MPFLEKLLLWGIRGHLGTPRNIPRNLVVSKMKTQKETLTPLCKILNVSSVNVWIVWRNKNHGRLRQMAIGRFVGIYQKAFISFLLKATFMSSHDCNIVNNIPVCRRCKFYLHCFFYSHFLKHVWIEAQKYVSRVLPENKVTCYVKLG